MDPSDASDPVFARIPFLETIEGAKLGPRQRLPGGRVYAARRLDPGWPGDVYRALKAKVAQLEVKNLPEQHEQALAAILTVAVFLDHGLREFHQARNRANDVLGAMGRLLAASPTQRAGANASVLATLAALEDDSMLTKVRGPDHVAAAAWPIHFPLRERLSELGNYFGNPGPRPWADLMKRAVEFEDWAALYVGETTDGPVDIDGVGRLLFPGGQPVSADNVGRWTCWAVAALLEEACGRTRGANQEAARVIENALPWLSTRHAPIDVDRSRYKAWLAYFTGRHNGAGSQARDYSNSPSALWLGRHGGLARAFEALC